MRVSYGEGLANHAGPESCGSIREDVAEALTGVRAGWVLSLEKVFIPSAAGSESVSGPGPGDGEGLHFLGDPALAADLGLHE